MADATVTGTHNDSQPILGYEARLEDAIIHIEDLNIEIKNVLTAAEVLAWRIKDGTGSGNREISALTGLIHIIMNRSIEISSKIERSLEGQVKEVANV